MSIKNNFIKIHQLYHVSPYQRALCAMVTGGASGLGLATVRRLVHRNYNVALVDLAGSDGQRIADEIGRENKRVLFCPADVSSEEQVTHAFDAVANKFSRLDVLVNCAGIAIGGKLYDAEKREMVPMGVAAKLMDVNILGTVSPIRHAIPLMLQNAPDGNGQRGVIVNTASISAYEGHSGQALYSASKGAITALTLPLARDLAPDGIRVVSIAPGIFDTPLMWGIFQKEIDYFKEFIPFPNRLGAPAEFAQLVEQIVDNPYLNGDTIRLDGAVRVPLH